MPAAGKGRRYRWVHDRCRTGPRARYRLKHIVLEASTQFQDVGIYDLHKYGRALFLDGVLQSAESDERRYHEMLVHPAMLAHLNPRRVLIAGGAEGATLREVLRHPTVQRAIVAELDEELVAICREHLPGWSEGAFEDPQSECLFGDARSAIEKNRQAFDVCICDLTEPMADGASVFLYTVEFFRAVRRCLRPGGIVATQAGALGEKSSGMFLTVRAGLRRAFKYVSAYRARIPSFREPWGFLFASGRVELSRFSVEKVRRRTAERKIGHLSYYGPGTHGRMFHLPGAVSRRALRNASSDARPFTMV